MRSRRILPACLVLVLIIGGQAISAVKIAPWGEPVDPDGDCTIEIKDGALTLSIPATVHDLWVGRTDPGQRFNAPRVWQPVEGDFVAQVKVTADWVPKKKNDAINNGAGLVVWESEDEFIRRERHAFMSQGAPRCFKTPLYFRGTTRLDEKQLTEANYYKGQSTWLRVERKGQEVKTAISHDGKKWIDTGALKTTFPKRVFVGVHAFNISPIPFEARFEDYSLKRK